MKHFDLIVVGGGHAGVEACHISAQFNIQVALITMPGVGIGSAPCNPSVGGVGKGQVVRELDALGGAMGKLADKTGIQFRTLNDSKGYAVQSTRVQIDKIKYSEEAEELLASIPNLDIIREKVVSVEKVDERFVIHTTSSSLTSTKVIFTVGTFLNGKLHTGSEQRAGGRVDATPSVGLNELFSQIKKRPLRFKTGTPPRINKNTINFSVLEEQPSDPETRNFHFLNSFNDRNLKQISCWLTRTNEETLKIIRDNKSRSPMFNGQIQGVGARYCPSIEDKAYRYPDKNVHHVFLEPESHELETYYPSGISTSLPSDVQEAFVHSIKGLENAKIDIPGYAVEYDIVDTAELSLSLEYKSIPGLYFAGQVNGTSGYEEAAGQGYIAGVNAALSLTGQEPLILSRNESYIGVMIEDLVTNHRDEPYRLFTARAENRLHLREDNTIQRMAPYRSKLGLKTVLDFAMENYLFELDTYMKFFDNFYVSSHDPIWQLFDFNTPYIPERRHSITEILRLAQLGPIGALKVICKYFDIKLSEDLIRTIAISKKYGGYIQKSSDQFDRIQKLDETAINWQQICESKNVSFECKQRIQKIQPTTFGQLKRISGIRPATLAVVASRAL